MILSNELKIIISAAMPIIELRYSVPYGILGLKEPIAKTFVLAVIGNMIPVAPILLFLSPLSERLRHVQLWSRFFDWLFEHARKKGQDMIEKYEALGLAIFVTIPLPATGAWTGCVLASLFKIRFRYAFLSILLGVVIAGVIMTFLSVTGRAAYEKVLPLLSGLFGS